MKRFQICTRPAFLSALALLLVNDLYLKSHHPSAITGKLSDLAAIITIPLRLAIHNRHVMTGNAGFGGGMFTLGARKTKRGVRRVDELIGEFRQAFARSTVGLEYVERLEPGPWPAIDTRDSESPPRAQRSTAEL